MSIGLIALLDDVTGLAKAAAASVDDIVGQTAKAGVRAAGVVIDDAAVTPRYVVGLSPARELPIIGRITLGSLRNKLLFLLPIALALSFFAPWAITPLLMVGGAYLCFEGTEKVAEALFHGEGHAHRDAAASVTVDPTAFENEKVASAIKTDFILSAEIMAITLAEIPEGSFWMQAIVLATVGVFITLGVYGVVALIVKADDVGLALARNRSDTALARLGRSLGRALVVGMPVFLRILGVVGTAAMIWVGGGILVHGLEVYGMPTIGHAIHGAAEAAAHAVPAVGGLVNWLVTAAGSGVVGLAVGAVLIPVTAFVISPLWTRLKGLRGARG